MDHGEAGSRPERGQDPGMRRGARVVRLPGLHVGKTYVVVAVNRKLRGWSRYFSIGTLEPAYRTVDRYTEALFRQFLVRRHKVPERGNRPFSNRYLYEELGLVRLDDRRRMSRLHALT